MANFSNLALTVNGIKALLRAQIGEKLTLSKIGLGSGSTTNGTNLTSLVTPKLIMPISEKEINEDSGYMTISAIMTNENITEGFYWRETGLFFEDSNGNDVLFAYTCVTNNEYDYIPAYSDQRYLKYVRIADIVTGSADITIKETQGLLYVDTLTFESFKKEIKEAMENIESNSLTNKDEDGNQRQLVVNGTENNGKDAIYIVDTVNGKEVIFSIFGDHNLPPVVDNLESESSELGLSANQGRIIKQYITAENGTVFQFAYDESSGEYGHIVTDSEGADTFVPFSGKYRLQVIGALQNTNLGLNENSTWQEIIDGIYSLFPEMLDVLAYLGISSLSISGSSTSGSSTGGTWHYKNSGKFDITHFNTLTYVLSLDTSGGQANCVLYYEGGTMTLAAGSKSVDVSACKGEAYFRVGQTQVWHTSGEGWSSGGKAYLTTAKLYV